jgi:hypothetical protein
MLKNLNETIEFLEARKAKWESYLETVKRGYEKQTVLVEITKLEDAISTIRRHANLVASFEAQVA